MYTNENAYVKQISHKDVKLSDEELSEFPFFSNLTHLEREKLLETVYTISMILYKTFEHENT